ncbi:hypothetical protein [Photorhabdus heterorhabditis]|uniref:hypothetical protein n=1 Tax=Photorhabdus heterorhabditis TaxID=880156 RepID=UPI001561F5D2|nr:hypothetical protein [Photorhabdus heterorhabditis]NRN29692.1 hypothetical protein [Photorhabdus heterorhabditis subsp. aluminescens]
MTTLNPKDNHALALALSQTYASIYGEAKSEEIYKDLRNAFNDENSDAEFAVVFQRDKAIVLKLNALTPLQSIGNMVSINSKYYHVNCKKLDVKEIDFNKEVEMLRSFPVIRMVKDKKEFNKKVSEQFESFGLNEYLNAEDLHYSFAKAKELNNERLSAWLADIIDKQHKYILREHFVKVSEAHYDSLDDFNNAVRPLMLELGFPEELVNHSFNSLKLHDSKSWDYTVAKQIEFLAKKEYYLIEERIKLEALKDKYKVLSDDDAKDTKNDSTNKRKIGFNVFKIIGYVFWLLLNKFIFHSHE